MKFRTNLFSLNCLQCVESLAQSNSSLAVELCNILSTYEMEGLLQAHDRIATTTDRSPAPNIYASSSMDSGSEIASNQSLNQNIVNNNVLKVNEVGLGACIFVNLTLITESSTCFPSAATAT